MTPERMILWVAFNVFVLGMLALDLGVFHRNAHKVSLREALSWSVVWITLALLFNLSIYYFWGTEKALEFLAGYLIEKSLSVDNIFIFLVIFSYFSVPAMYQHRVLFWGILGALVMRAIFIAVGAALLTAFHWMIYVFGGFLVITGVKLLLTGDHQVEPEKNPAVRLLRRVMHVTPLSSIRPTYSLFWACALSISSWPGSWKCSATSRWDYPLCCALWARR